MAGLIRVDAPAGLVGDHFKSLVEGLGYTGVRVTLVGDALEVFADELTGHMPPAEDRSGLTDEECAVLCAECQAAAEHANADDSAAIAALASSYSPPPATDPVPSTEELLAAALARIESLEAALGNS